MVRQPGQTENVGWQTYPRSGEHVGSFASKHPGEESKLKNHVVTRNESLLSAGLTDVIAGRNQHREITSTGLPYQGVEGIASWFEHTLAPEDWFTVGQQLLLQGSSGFHSLAR